MGKKDVGKWSGSKIKEKKHEHGRGLLSDVLLTDILDNSYWLHQLRLFRPAEYF